MEVYNNFAYSNKGIVSLAPPYQEVIVNKNVLFKHFKRALYIRWDSDFEKTDKTNYYHVIKDGGCPIESLPSKTRNQIRKCLKNCEVQRVDSETIISKGGYDVYTSECRRYQRKGYAASIIKTEKQWADGMREAVGRGQECWAVLCDNKVIAYSLCWRKEAHVDLTAWKVDYENYNHLYPSYGLVYTMCEYYLSLNDVKYVDDGGRSLTQHSNVQDFLIDKFCFRKAYSRLHAEFRWYLLIVLWILAPFERLIKNNNVKSLLRLYKWSR